jgi:hypothetical protein
MLYHIGRANEVWGQGKELGRYEVLEGDLNKLYLMTRARRSSSEGACEEVRCMHFLSLAWHCISDALAGQHPNLHTFSCCLRRFWLAFTAVGVDLVSFARRSDIDVPEDEIRLRIRDALHGDHADDQIHCDITNGFANIATDIKNYEAWHHFMQIWGPIVDTLPDYWLGALRDDQKIADAHVASGAASMVELWNAMALLYATESRDADAAQRQKLDPLYDAVIRICLQACEIVAVYHSTRPEATAGSAEKLEDWFYAIVRLERHSLDEVRIKRLVQGLKAILDKPKVNNAGRKFIQDMLDILKQFPVSVEPPTLDDPVFPAR